MSTEERIEFLEKFAARLETPVADGSDHALDDWHTRAGADLAVRVRARIHVLSAELPQRSIPTFRGGRS